MMRFHLYYIKKVIKLQKFLEDYKVNVLRLKNLEDETIWVNLWLLDDLKILTKIKTILKLFYEVIEWLKKNFIKRLKSWKI